MSIGAYLSRFGKEHEELQNDEEHLQWIKQVKKAVLKVIEKQTESKSQWIEGEEPDKQIGQELGGWGNVLQLQRYAAHIQFTGKPPESPAEDDELDNDEYLMRYREAMEEDIRWEHHDLAFRHLIMTADQINFLPIDFPEPLLIEEEDGDETISVGSSQKLYQDLEEINKYLLMVGDYDQLGDEEAWKFYENEEDQWRFVRWAWIVLHWLARESVNRKLCIYFE